MRNGPKQFGEAGIVWRCHAMAVLKRTFATQWPGRLRLFFQVFALLFVALIATTGAEPSFEKTVQPFLESHCIDCHGPDEQKSSIRYDDINAFTPNDSHLWTKVHEALTSAEMPPENKPRPDAKQQAEVLAWIQSEQRRHRTGSTRRLNRRELSAALQDLTGLDLDFAFALPEDGKVNGFDTGASALQDAADSVAQVLEVTRRAVNAIGFHSPTGGKHFAADFVNPPDPRSPNKALDSWKKERGAHVSLKGRWIKDVGWLIDPKWLKDKSGWLSFHLPIPESEAGVARLTCEVSSMSGDFEGIPRAHLWVKAGGHVREVLDVTEAPNAPRRLQYDIQIEDAILSEKGLGFSLQNRVEVPYAVKGFENDDRTKPEDNVPGGGGLFRPLWDRKKIRDPLQMPVPFIVVHNIQVDVGRVANWPPSDWEVEIPAFERETDEAAWLLNLWITRAWRRPIQAGEADRFLGLYKKQRQQGESFDDALRSAFHSVLLSAPFRYLESPVQTERSRRDDPYRFAARLSFMLTGAPPDDELHSLARDGKLLEAKILDAQTDRLLAGSESDKFFQPFVRQWLLMDQPITLAMDHLKKIDFQFGRHLKDSMQQETIQYVRGLFEENRPARELIASDWTLMNNILARHYKYPPLEGSQLRKVKLKDDPRGGGVLSHAGIQSMLCWMGENWVIYRGAWTLRHILDTPPPPAPLEVPELTPSDAKNAGKPFRELLKQHQEDPRCTVCHKAMDPMGFAFQNFDISGRWRDREYASYHREEIDGKVAWRGKGESRPVDAVGALPRGEAFTSFAECQKLLVKNYMDDIVLGLLKNLTLYGTGKLADVDGLAELREIMATHRGKGYRTRDLLKALIRSRLFKEN